MVSGGQEAERVLRNSQASDYDRSFLMTRGAYGFASQVRTVLYHLALSPQDVVLDLGCGTGVYTIEVARIADSVLGIDFSESSIELLKAKAVDGGVANLVARVEDALEWEPPKERFSKAMSIEVLQHMPDPRDRVRVLGAIREALRPGGVLVLLLYRYGGWIKPPKPKESRNESGLYRFAFERDDVVRLIADSGFRLIHLGGSLNVPKRIRKRLPPRFSAFDVFLSKFSVSRYLGDYFVVVARK